MNITRSNLVHLQPGDEPPQPGQPRQPRFDTGAPTMARTAGRGSGCRRLNRRVVNIERPAFEPDWSSALISRLRIADRVPRRSSQPDRKRYKNYACHGGGRLWPVAGKTRERATEGQVND